MRIERAVFLELTVALAAWGCGQTGQPAVPPGAEVASEPAPTGLAAGEHRPPATTGVASPQAGGPVVVTVPAAASTSELAEPHELEPEPLPVKPKTLAACDNTRPNLSPCQSIGPACEGLSEECVALSGRLDPRDELEWSDPPGPGPEAERRPAYDGFRPRVAETIARCWARTEVGGRCRDGRMAACIREAVEQTCVEPGTEKSCDRILTSCAAQHMRPAYTKPQCMRILSSVLGKARRDAEHALSPMREGCVLEFVLPYYPYGSTWGSAR